MSEPAAGFEFERRHVPALPGQTIGAALMAAGVVELRRGPDGKPRGMFCGIGVCFECMVAVQGKGTVRSCVQPAEPGMRVSRAGP